MAGKTGQVTEVRERMRQVEAALEQWGIEGGSVEVFDDGDMWVLAPTMAEWRVLDGPHFALEVVHAVAPLGWGLVGLSQEPGKPPIAKFKWIG